MDGQRAALGTVNVTVRAVKGRPSGSTASIRTLCSPRGRPTRMTELAPDAAQALGVARGEDDFGAFGAGTPSGLEADARAAADHDENLSDHVCRPSTS